jgi:hypothetical protein
MKIAEQFDQVSSLHVESNAHSDANLSKDISAIVNELHDKFKVYQYVPKRKHQHFSGLTKTLLASVKKAKEKLFQWMKNN